MTDVEPGVSLSVGSAVGVERGEEELREEEEMRFSEVGEEQESAGTDEGMMSGGEGKDGERPYEAHKSPEGGLGDEMDIGGEVSDLEETTYEPHKFPPKGDSTEEGDDAHNEEDIDGTVADSSRWKEKGTETDDIFVVEHRPPSNPAKFTPSVVGTKITEVNIDFTNFNSTTDAPNVASRLPKGLRDPKKDLIVCFHPRQFHRVEVIWVFSLLFMHFEM
jgi:hypothetical protein